MARDWDARPLTSMEHMAADMRAKRFPTRSEPEEAMAQIDAENADAASREANGLFYPLFSFLRFDFETGKGEIEIDSYGRYDHIGILGSDYALVPLAELERAFASLQDAGETVGVPPGRNIIRYLERMKAYVEELEGAVGEAMAKYREYEKLHEAKGTEDGRFKARANGVFAERMEAVLDNKESWGV